MSLNAPNLPLGLARAALSGASGLAGFRRGRPDPFG